MKPRVCSGYPHIEGATRLARAMVTRWGFSDEVGTVAYGENNDEVFLGYSMGRQTNVSGSTLMTIEKEIRRLVDAGTAKAREIIEGKRDQLEIIARGLLEYETLSGDEIQGLLRGDKPNREEPADTEATRPQSSVPTGGRGKPSGGFDPAPQPG